MLTESNSLVKNYAEAEGEAYTEKVVVYLTTLL